MTDPNPVVAALLASGKRELAKRRVTKLHTPKPTPPEDTAVSHAETPADPIPAEGAPHAYVAVQRRHSVNADRPEWDHRAVVIPAHDTVELDYACARDITLLPIGPDGDTGTRAIVEPRKVTTVAELDALPIGSVILLEYGVIAQAVCGDEDVAAIGWAAIGKDLVWSSARVVEYAGKGASFTVLYVPEAVTA